MARMWSGRGVNEQVAVDGGMVGVGKSRWEDMKWVIGKVKGD